MEHRRAEQRLRALRESAPPRAFAAALKGLEKESLRVDASGFIAQTPHPRALGAPLTHPHLTTDFSEALTEFITPPFGELEAMLSFLRDLHGWVHARLENELLWAASMPCRVSSDESVPIAEYGTSNRALMKHIYRRGLSWRYGRLMQTIAGIHFNYSFAPELFEAYAAVETRGADLRAFSSAAYFDLIRNFHRFGWLVPYLFGASPAVCGSFLSGHRASDLQQYRPGTLFRPYATSLRMSDIGYKNKTQARLEIGYADLESYIRTLSAAIAMPYPDYQRIGVRVDGEWRQLSANILQIENEFYSSIRPKQIADPGERPTLALARRGVRYVEVRAFDVSPYEPLGVNAEQLRFTETLLLFCLLQDSPPITAAERTRNEHNQALTASRGRDPETRLLVLDGERPLRAWVDELCDRMQGCAEALDAARGDDAYSLALAHQREANAHPEMLPSARILEDLGARNQSFYEFCLHCAEAQHEAFLRHRLSAQREREFQSQATDSIAALGRAEAEDTVDFETYLKRYFEGA